jgi:hypothetical protein
MIDRIKSDIFQLHFTDTVVLKASSEDNMVSPSFKNKITSSLLQELYMVYHILSSGYLSLYEYDGVIDVTDELKDFDEDTEFSSSHHSFVTKKNGDNLHWDYMVINTIDSRVEYFSIFKDCDYNPFTFYSKNAGQNIVTVDNSLRRLDAEINNLQLLIKILLKNRHYIDKELQSMSLLEFFQCYEPSPSFEDGGSISELVEFHKKFFHTDSLIEYIKILLELCIEYKLHRVTK